MKEPADKVRLKEEVDIESLYIRQDDYFRGAYVVDLPLDSTPNHIWQDIFEREWKASKQIWDRKIFIVGDRLRLITPPAELKEKIEWVKYIVEQTNKSIDEYNQESQVAKERVERAKEEALREDEAKVKEIRELLKESFRPV